MSETKMKISDVQFRPAHEGEPEWLYTLRKSAWESYSEMPLPDRVVHLWKYTDPKDFVPENISEVANLFPVSTNGKSEMAPEVPEYGSAVATTEPDRHLLTRISDEAKSQGVLLVDLLTATQKHEEIVSKYLGQAIGRDFGKFEALNLATWNSGLLLYVPSGVNLSKPIHLHRMPTDGATVTRLLVIADRNSEFTVIDDYENASGESASMNSVVEVIAEESSRVKFTTIVRLGGNDTLHLTQRNHLGRDAAMNSHAVAVGAGKAKVNWGTVMQGRGSTSHWTGMLMGGQRQHFDLHTIHRHSAGETYSNLDYKVALKEEAVSAYTGRINIDEDAAFCEAYQENRNLLLSDKAKVESIPELEIINDEVKCSHGVTVGMLEDEQIFYLTSRGINPDEAMRIILQGFFEQPLEAVPESYRDLGRSLLMDKLEA